MSSVVLRSIASTQSQNMSALGASPMAHLDADMRHVLDIWAALEPKPISACTPLEARTQPTLMAAFRHILRGRSDAGGVSMEMRMIDGPGGELPIRIYAPATPRNGGPMPMILYLHGGGFVIGDLDRDDETPRALCRRCEAIVVSAHYRQAPEHPFPAAHEDAAAAWQWMRDNAGALDGDAGRIALVGEDAGGNLALNLALDAKANQSMRPRHVALITPMVDAYAAATELAELRPFDAESIAWFYRNAAESPDALRDPRFALLDRDFGGLPPTTLVLAGADPLRAEGEALGEGLRRSGVWVDATVYDGVTAQFFGLARIVNKAMFAQGQVVRNLNESFATA